MPEIDAGKLDCSVQFLGRSVKLPFFISCMTGGATNGLSVNRELAMAAQALGIPVGMGSIRVLASRPDLAEQFRLKRWAPDVPVLANIGAVQVRDMPAAEILRLVALTEADALVIHLNAGQELFQPGGDRNFTGISDALARFAEKSPYPVIVKETGFGIAPEEIKFLLDSGVAYVDLAGAGGTNWISVEAFRLEGADASVAEEFRDWGYKTAQLLQRAPTGTEKILASGGIRTGGDCAKALALGAVLCGMATPLVRCAASGGSQAVVDYLERLAFALKTIMVLTGSPTIASLRREGVISSAS